MNNSTSNISNHIRGFDIGSRIFLKTANTEHKEKFVLFVGINALEDNIEHLTS